MGEITWLGHAAFMVEIKGRVFLFDPWIRGNPSTPLSGLADIKKADFVFVTHDHRDHGLSDGLEICENHGATLVCTTDLAKTAVGRDIKVVSGNLGGQIEIDDIEIFFTPAVHVSPVLPCGFVLVIGELAIYHAGDTAFFSDMEYIARQHQLDWAFLPIGSTYTMGPADASKAVEKLEPQKVIPCHFNTFDSIKQDPKAFNELVEGPTEVIIISPGESVAVDESDTRY